MIWSTLLPDTSAYLTVELMEHEVLQGARNATPRFDIAVMDTVEGRFPFVRQPAMRPGDERKWQKARAA